MPARGVRTTAGASRTAAILHTRSALRPYKAWQDIVRRTHSREPPMGQRLEAGMVARHPGAIGGAIKRRVPVAAASPADGFSIAAEASPHVPRHRLRHLRRQLERRQRPHRHGACAMLRGDTGTIIAVITALGGMALSGSQVDAGAWCATYRWGSVNCGYSSSDQCWATVRGIGGFCRPHPAIEALAKPAQNIRGGVATRLEC